MTSAAATQRCFDSAGGGEAGGKTPSALSGTTTMQQPGPRFSRPTIQINCKQCCRGGRVAGDGVGANYSRSAGKKTNQMEKKLDLFSFFFFLFKMWRFLKSSTVRLLAGFFLFFVFFIGFCFFQFGTQVSFVSHVNPNQPDGFFSHPQNNNRSADCQTPKKRERREREQGEEEEGLMRGGREGGDSRSLWEV